MIELLPLLRTLGALGLVIGGLALALWVVRRYDIQLPGRVSAGGGRTPNKRIEVVERVSLDGRRSAILLRRDDREHLFLLGPDGATILETRIARDDFGRTLARVI